MRNTTVTPTLDTVKQQVDAYLMHYSQQRIEDARDIGPSYVRLRQAINRLIEVGGKRLRPFMVLLAYDAYAPQPTIESVLPAAAAQELLHLAMLIHDDIIDRDLIRCGRHHDTVNL